MAVVRVGGRMRGEQRRKAENLEDKTGGRSGRGGTVLSRKLSGSEKKVKIRKIIRAYEARKRGPKAKNVGRIPRRTDLPECSFGGKVMSNYRSFQKIWGSRGGKTDRIWLGQGRSARIKGGNLNEGECHRGKTEGGRLGEREKAWPGKKTNADIYSIKECN